jgi:hypothetical protein
MMKNALTVNIVWSIVIKKYKYILKRKSERERSEIEYFFAATALHHFTLFCLNMQMHQQQHEKKRRRGQNEFSHYFS